MKTRIPLCLAILAACALPTMALAPSALAGQPHRPPNILLILTDDLGYGDVGCYGATRVKTPNIDRLAAGGLRFTDAHSTSATCTPSRYALMTGEYPWRKQGTGVLPGDAALIVEPGRTTLPSVLHQAGYATGCVGKWHLGLGRGNLDWNGPIRPGPLEIGFDYAFIIPATGDRVPCVYVENHRVAGLDPKDPIRVSYAAKIGDEPTGREHPDLLTLHPSRGHDATIVNGISRIGFMSGGRAARWKDEDMADVLTQKAVRFIEQHKQGPFFLYFATHDIHVPRVPHPRFRGTSQCGVRGDVVHQLDWCVGELLATIDRLGLAKDTLVIFTSDNGPVVDDGYADGAVRDLNGHVPAGPLRGGKYSIYEGGTRVPFLASWPGRIKPGQSQALVSQVDLLATLAALAGQKLPPDAAPDSFNVLPALLGQSPKGRDHVVEHAGALAIRQGLWKLIAGQGAAKAPAKKAKAAAKKPRDTGPGPGRVEVYDLGQDLGETKNLGAQRPEMVEQLTTLLRNLRESGRSRSP
jgi:arylsulfatase A-like enzyme